MPVDGAAAENNLPISSPIRSAETVATSGARGRDRRCRALRQREPEARRELGCPQHAKRVVLERRFVDDVDPRQADVLEPAVRIDQQVVGEPPRDHVHPEIPPAEIILQWDLRPRLDGKILVTGPDRAFAARQGDIGFAGRMAEFEHGERGADHIDPPGVAQPLEQRFERQPGDDVVQVLRRSLDPVEPDASLVPHPAADGEDGRRVEGRLQNVIEGVAHGAPWARGSSTISFVPASRLIPYVSRLTLLCTTKHCSS